MVLLYLRELVSSCEPQELLPRCPIEWDDQLPATWKEWRSRQAADGNSYQQQLQTVAGTRKDLMERVQAVFADADPHLWIEAWQMHQRHLVYSTFTDNEIVVSTDFSAQFDHKCAWTLTCEHPPRSNQAVYVVTHSPGVDGDGERTVSTDVWRMFSEMKGDALFHNTALAHSVDYYANELPALEQAHVFTDGCRSQYKGRRNFAKIAAFPSVHNGVKLRHHFAAGHHFKGPHDAFGKDPTFLARMAERHQRARIATPCPGATPPTSTLAWMRPSRRCSSLAPSLARAPPAAALVL